MVFVLSAFWLFGVAVGFSEVLTLNQRILVGPGGRKSRTDGKQRTELIELHFVCNSCSLYICVFRRDSRVTNEAPAHN